MDDEKTVNSETKQPIGHSSAPKSADGFEIALRESEALLRRTNNLLEAVTSGADVIVAVVDTNYKYIFFNEAYKEEIKRLTGKEIEIGASLPETYDGMPKQRDIAKEHRSRVLRGEIVEPYRIEFGDPGRYRRVYSVRQSPIRDAEGNIIAAGEVAFDITERALAEQALNRNAKRDELLSETATRLLMADNPQALVEELCEKVMKFLDCQAFFNFLVDEPAGKLHLNACAGIPKEEADRIKWLDYGIAVCGCVARDGCRIIAEDIQHVPDPRTELVKSYGIQAYCCHPLLSHGGTIGTLSFGTKTRTSFSEEDISMMKGVADLVAVAMQRMHTVQALSKTKEDLKKSRDELEERVRERTAELVEVNIKLAEEITERVTAQEAVSIERQRMMDVLNLLPAYVILLSPDYRVPFANRFFVERFGKSNGMRCYEYLFNRTEPCEVAKRTKS